MNQSKPHFQPLSRRVLATYEYSIKPLQDSIFGPVLGLEDYDETLEITKVRLGRGQNGLARSRVRAYVVPTSDK
jgi:hypothetical protein